MAETSQRIGNDAYARERFLWQACPAHAPIIRLICGRRDAATAHGRHCRFSNGHALHACFDTTSKRAST